MHYLVTGATGLLGSHLVDRLVERGDRVRAIVLDPAEAAPLRARGIDVLSADLAKATDQTRAVDGVDVVIHCAGVVHLGARRRELWAVNVEGADRLLAASARVGVSRFVYVSSVAVYGHAPSPIAEDAPKQPVGAYGASKWAAEQLVWRYQSEHGLPAVAIRPCPIYGLRDRRISRALLRLGRLRIVPLPKAGRRILALVYVSDVVDATLAAATSPRAVGHAYNVTDGETHTYRDFLATIGKLTRRRPVILSVPGPALVLTLQAFSCLRNFARLRQDGLGQLSRIRALDLDIHYSIDAARRDLAYTPQVDLSEGIRRILEDDRAVVGA